MAELLSRSRSRRTFVAKAAQPAVAGSRDLGGVARLTQGNGGFTGYGQVTIPPETEQAMVDQGMQTGGPFSPGRPIQQFAPWGMDPRSWDFPVGYNISTRPRSQQGRVSFETLKGFIEAWDVLRLCFNHIQRDIRSMDWSIVPMVGLEEDVSDQVRQATKIMSKPDGSKPFDAWQWEFLEDVLRYDAGTLFRRRNRAGEVMALEVVSGTQIGPLIDYYGRRPQGDAPAFVEYVSGVPWQWLRSDALVYQPFAPQPESVYGLPVAEWLLLTGNTDLRFQWHFLTWFTAGSVPEGFMEAPPDMSDPENIIKFQAAWDAVMEGDADKKHQVRWVPSGAKPMFPAIKNFDPNFPLYLMRKTAAACGVTPNDLGFTDAVNKASADTQVDVQFRIGTMPLIRYCAGIYTAYLQEDRGLPVEFQFDTGREKEDRLDEARAWDFYVRMGAASPDEPREQVLGLPVDRENPTPRFVVDRTGIVPLLQIQADSGKIDPATVAPLPERVAAVHSPGEDIVARTIEAPPAPAPDNGSPSPIQGAPKPVEPAPQGADGQPEGSGGEAVAKSRIGRGALRKARRREVAAASPPFAKAAEPPPMASRYLREQIAAAEDHYADAVQQALAGAADPHAMAAGWLQAQPMRKAGGAIVSADLLGAAREYARRFHIDLGAMADIIRAVYVDGWRLGIGSALKALAGKGFPAQSGDPAADIDWSTWEPGNPAAAQQAARLSELLAQADVVIRGIDDASLQRIAAILAQGAAAGDSVDTIAKALGDLLDDPERARVIAHTELARAVSAASLDTYAQNGIGWKSWLTANPCPLCAANAAVGVIPRGQAFPSGDQAPPGHTSCRCSVVPEQAPKEA